MKKNQIFLMFRMLMLCMLVLGMGCKKKKVAQERLCSRIELDEIVRMLPKTAQEVTALVQNSQKNMDQALKRVASMSPAKRDYFNTVLEYEQAYFQFYSNSLMLQVLATLAQDGGVQSAAAMGCSLLQQYDRQNLKRNNDLFKALREYDRFGHDYYRNLKVIRYWLDDMQRQFKQQNLSMTHEQQQKIEALQQEVRQVVNVFNANIANNAACMLVTQQDLQGVPVAVMQTLSQDDQGQIKLPVDIQLFFTIMENCEIEKTRHDYFFFFSNVAYPANDEILKSLIAKRHELARTLGFESFSQYQVSSLMAKSVEQADAFLWDAVHAIQPYVTRDFQALIKDLPAGVTLTQDGKLTLWDDAFVKSWYRKHHFGIDDHEISHYFPLDYVLSAMLQQLGLFFHVKFEPQVVQKVWADDVICYRMRSMKHQAILGYLFFDLHKRALKNNCGECQWTLIPALRDDCSITCASAAVVVANFDKPIQAGAATLMEFSQVSSLLHEIGHAMHAMFGATKFTKYSGTQVMQDFLEVPSQVLEHWLEQPEFLAKITRHDQTGQPMSLELMNNFIAAQKFGKAGRMLKQLFLGLVALHLFHAPVCTDPHELVAQLFQKVFEHVAYDSEYFLECSFTHLGYENYAAAYYTYPWSQIIAADLFGYIKKHGMYHHEVGERYINDILSPGGFGEPDRMIQRFLNRPWSMTSFLESVQG